MSSQKLVKVCNIWTPNTETVLYYVTQNLKLVLAQIKLTKVGKKKKPELDIAS